MSAHDDQPTGRLDATVAELIRVIDTEIAADRKLYLACYFAGHDAEARCHVVDVDRLISIRNLIEREAAQ